MKILVIGSGGREHALVWKIAQSKVVEKIFCAPGNGGIAEIAECVNIKVEDITGLLDFAKIENIDLTVVGPEVPLALGIVDEFANHNLKIFGPCKKAAQLEASKVFAKEFMAKYNIPTASFKVFDDYISACGHLDTIQAPCVVKADGLAAGKGVVVAKTISEAKDAVRLFMQEKTLGEAGTKIIIEECLEGEEASILVFTDSKEVIPLASSQDHKRIFDADKGANTGGMGAYSPAPVVTDELLKDVLNKIVFRVVDGLAEEGIIYKGVLYAGIMITKDGPRALEFNVRFGDPETQAILPRLEDDIVEVMMNIISEKLSRISRTGGLSWNNRSCVCVVCAAGGYPGEYEKGKEISGLDKVSQLKDIVVFHAGTKKVDDKVFTNGGRVLGICGLGNTIKDAIELAYRGVKEISFDGMQFRKDIGQKALK
jgi:phosphoribosylamine--glycine ligase